MGIRRGVLAGDDDVAGSRDRGLLTGPCRRGRGGWISRIGTRLRPVTSPLVRYVPAEEDAAAFTQFAQGLLTLLLLSLLEAEAEDEDEDAMQGGSDTIAALMYAADPEGLDLPDTMTGAPRATGVPHDLDEMKRLWRIVGDLSRIAALGLLQHDGRPGARGTHYSGSLAIFIATTNVIEMMRGDDEVA